MSAEDLPTVQGSQPPSFTPGAAPLWAQASHDLRQPVQALLLLARTLPNTPPGELGAVARHLESAVQGLQGMLETLADLARLEAGLVDAGLAPCPLLEATARALEETRWAYEEQGVSVRRALGPWMVRSSAKRLPVLISSLVLNAVKHARGSEILIASRRRGSRLDLELYHRGPGVSAAEARGAFIELRRGPGQTELALGPAAVAYLSRALGHTFAAQSLPGGGQRFVVSMALAEPALAVSPRR
jgi:two-component system, sensor histidine kinase